ncbi:MAG: hypothetical protein KatS3mg033_1741 [Thermonema sp.]|uniref:DUF2752 domain-containing protein n=1 Tax=Thermonema sp. TaxID=2231181 RepID=UPI0021DDA3FE|nr:DUF2752 domain-containing protein [Thermonema sp.]GIV39941.1 MAG: hypothetical protein KatS3mg033_1741 [Thermonema sp.]
MHKQTPADIRNKLQVQKKKRFYAFTSLLVLAAYAWISWHLYAGHQAAKLGVCWSKNLLGIACPGCGTTRGMLAALQGYWQRALYYNPLSFPALMALALLPFFLLYDLIKKKTLTYSLYLLAERWLRRPAVLLPLAVLIVLNWLWNIQKEI